MDLLRPRHNRSTPNLLEQFQISATKPDIVISKSSDDLLLHLQKDSRPAPPPRAGSSNAILQKVTWSNNLATPIVNSSQLWIRYSPRDEVYEPDPERMMDTVLGQLLMDPSAPLDARYNQMILHIFESYRMMKRELTQTKNSYLRALTDYDRAKQNDIKEIELYLLEIQRLKMELRRVLSGDTGKQKAHWAYMNDKENVNPTELRANTVPTSISFDNNVRQLGDKSYDDYSRTIIFATPPRRNDREIVLSAQKRRHRDIAIHTITPQDSTTTFGIPVEHRDDDSTGSPIIHYGDEDEDSGAEKSLPPTPTSQHAFAKMKHELGPSTNIYYPTRHHRTVSDPVVGSVEDMKDAIEDLITSYHRDSTAPSSRHSFADARTSRSESFSLDILGRPPIMQEPVVTQTRKMRNRPRSILTGLRDGLRLHPVGKSRKTHSPVRSNSRGSMMKAENNPMFDMEHSRNVGGVNKPLFTDKSNDMQSWNHRAQGKDKKKGGIWRNNLFWHPESNF